MTKTLIGGTVRLAERMGERGDVVRVDDVIHDHFFAVTAAEAEPKGASTKQPPEAVSGYVFAEGEIDAGIWGSQSDVRHGCNDQGAVSVEPKLLGDCVLDHAYGFAKAARPVEVACGLTTETNEEVAGELDLVADDGFGDETDAVRPAFLCGIEVGSVGGAGGMNEVVRVPWGSGLHSIDGMTVKLGHRYQGSECRNLCQANFWRTTPELRRVQICNQADEDGVCCIFK